MASFRQYRQSNHDHAHTCPSCKNTLEEIEHKRASVVELKCDTENCKISRCFCNGTYNQYTVTYEELFRCASDILSYVDEDYEFLLASQSPSDLGAAVHTAIDEHTFDEVVTKQKVEDLFRVFARLEMTLEKRNIDGLYQAKETGERVVSFGTVYVPYSEVLVYTIVGSDVSKDDAILQYPIAYATYLDESAVEPYDPDFKTKLSEYFE